MKLIVAIAVRSVTILIVAAFWPALAVLVAGLWAVYDGTCTEFGRLCATWLMTLLVVVLVGGGQLLMTGVFGLAWLLLLGIVVVAVFGAAVGSLFAAPEPD